MKIKEKICITFAGAVGSSKTPIAYYLSWKFNLPIINNDSIRTEVTEDLLTFSQEEYKKRRDERLKEILSAGKPFIYDASVDRKWSEFKKQLEEAGYHWFIINLDLSKGFLTKLYQTKGYTESLKRIDQLLTEHQVFLTNHNSEINVHITDQTFSNRLGISAKALAAWIKVNNLPLK